MFRHSFPTVLVLALGMFGAVGCATIENGPRQRIEVRSQPSGAAVTIDGAHVGHTPLVVSVPRRSAYLLMFKKDGFADGASMLMPSSRDYDQRLLKWGVDYMTGAANQFTPDTVAVQLRPDVLPTRPPADPFAEMTYNVLQADALLATGTVSRSDHSYMVAKIVEFYSR